MESASEISTQLDQQYSPEGGEFDRLSPTSTPSHVPLWVALTGSAVLVIVLGLAGYFALYQPMLTSSHIDPQVVQDALRTLQQSTPTPSRQFASSYLQIITDQERGGEYAVAASNATTALTNPDLSENDRSALAAKAVADSLEAIYQSRTDPDDFSGQEKLLAWFSEVQALSARFRVPLPGPLQIATRALDASEFVLAKEVLVEGVQTGEIQPTDLKAVRLLYQSYRNLGWWEVKSHREPYASAGQQLLLVANELDQRFHLHSGAAHADLVAFLGADERLWPQMKDDPVLAVSRR